ncbi:MAG: methyltransferase domain-containing protein [Nevskiaceae bacterium]
MEAVARASHAAPDRHSRTLKARKIERLLGPGVLRDGAALLDIGAGSGWIAAYFGRHPRYRLAVSAVDASDERVEKDGYAFRQVTGTALPFADASFDVVLSNHVIEHVGSEADQLAHLAEARRVLRPGGTLYLAVPNRWSLVEPHYRLPFLSWLPAVLASAFVRATGRGRWYDCRLLGPLQARRMLRRAGLAATDISAEALVAMMELERPGAAWAVRVAGWIRRWGAGAFGLLSPTLIFRVKA